MELTTPLLSELGLKDLRMNPGLRLMRLILVLKLDFLDLQDLRKKT